MVKEQDSSVGILWSPPLADICLLGKVGMYQLPMASCVGPIPS